MADAEDKAAEKLTEITECPICMGIFNDPRILPCIHTFCLECLKCSGEAKQKKPGDKMPCPMCRKQFTIPKDGINGLQKNFFMENLIEYKNLLQIGSTPVRCDMCIIRNEGKTENISTATTRCLECKENYCDGCSGVHRSQKLSKNHHIVKLGKETEGEIGRVISVKTCIKHIQKPLDYYCADCGKIVCVSCLLESHKFHDCRDVSTVDEEFRRIIGKNARNISAIADEILSMRKNTDMKKTDFLKQIDEVENAIYNKNDELKNMIDKHTLSLLEDLSVIKANHLKEIVNEMEEIDRCWTILKSFEAYCTQLSSIGSASDICSSVDDLTARADELEKHHEAFIDRPRKSIEVSFKTGYHLEFYKNLDLNFLGKIKETPVQNYATVIGLDVGRNITKDVIRINLHRRNEISTQQHIPTEMQCEATAAVYGNTIYIAGIGNNADEIWKYSMASGWMKCGSLVQGRRRHSAVFIDEVMYICGGFVESDGRVLDSVEAYNTDINKCSSVGKVVHRFESSGNCVSIKTSLYIFGGLNKDSNSMNHVQVYDTKQNTCTLLSKPMPYAHYSMRAVLWETSVILVGRNSCFIFNFEKETWQERKQFKTDVIHFGLVLENERIFVIGGGNSESGLFGKTRWKCRDDVRFAPLRNILMDEPVAWKCHAKLPRPALIHACQKLMCFVP